MSSFYSWDLYFTRFLVIAWFLVFPVIFLGLFFFLKDVNKHKNIVFVSNTLKDFFPYRYVFHNFLFVFFCVSFVLDLCVLLSCVIEVIDIKSEGFYMWVWDSKKPSQTDRVKFLTNIILPGFSLRSISCFLYVYYNLYNTNSIFGEKWRKFVMEWMKTNSFLEFQRSYPNLYSKLKAWFFEVNEVTLSIDNKKITLY